jgi:hypothetical protein
MTSDDEYLFLPSGKSLKQYKTHNHQLVKKYSFNDNIFPVMRAHDNTHVYIGLKDGTIHQICPKIQTVTNRYEYPLKFENIETFAVTRDNKFLIVACWSHHLRKISVAHGKVVKDFGKVANSVIVNLLLTPDDKICFVYDYNYNLKMIGLGWGRDNVIKDFGMVWPGFERLAADYPRLWLDFANHTPKILLTRDGRYLFAIGPSGRVKQFSVRGRVMVQEFGNFGALVQNFGEANHEGFGGIGD